MQVIAVENMRQIPWYKDLVATRDVDRDAALNSIQATAEERHKTVEAVYVWDGINYYAVLKEAAND